MQFKINSKEVSQLKADALIVIVNEGKAIGKIDSSTIKGIIEKNVAEMNKKKIKRELFIQLEDKSPIGNVLIWSTEGIKYYNLEEKIKIIGARVANFCKEYKLKKISFLLNDKDSELFIGDITEGIMLGTYSFEKYKKEQENFYNNFEVELVSSAKDNPDLKLKVKNRELICGCVNEAREIVNEPGEVVYPERLAELAKGIAQENGLTFNVLNLEELKKQGYLGIVKVGQGSSYPPVMLTLRYKKNNKNSKTDIVLIGKGITFDSGGLSLKPSESMLDMKGDMAGAAAVLYTMKAIAILKPKVNVTAIIPAAENLPDAKAQRPGDIFVAKNGKSVEVVNTDAEGRLILIDALALAAEEKPKYIIDIATLTGACVVALGEHISGVMGNNEGFIKMIINSGKRMGELFWELPLHEEYKELLKSPYADMRNVGKNRYGGTIVGGLFLQEFVPKDVAWAHLDIAGPSSLDKSWKYLQPGGTGVGVKTLVEVCCKFIVNSSI
ncbi:MAG: leucyl aminopeptidase [bacterium]